MVGSRNTPRARQPENAHLDGFLDVAEPRDEVVARHHGGGPCGQHPRINRDRSLLPASGCLFMESFRWPKGVAPLYYSADPLESKAQYGWLGTRDSSHVFAMCHDDYRMSCVIVPGVLVAEYSLQSACRRHGILGRFFEELDSFAACQCRLSELVSGFPGRSVHRKHPLPKTRQCMCEGNTAPRRSSIF